MTGQINSYAPPRAPVSEGPRQAPALWNPAAAGLWSLLLSVAFGAWLTMRNWDALGEPERARRSRTWFHASVAAVAVLVFTPRVGTLGLGYLIWWYIAQNRPQIQFIKNAFGDAYPRQPWGRVIGIALLILIPSSFVLGFASAMVFGPAR